MIANVTTIERAYALAKTGEFANVSDLKRALGKEGYLTEQIVGRTLLSDLRVIIQQGRMAHS